MASERRVFSYSGGKFETIDRKPEEVISNSPTPPDNPTPPDTSRGEEPVKVSNEPITDPVKDPVVPIIDPPNNSPIDSNDPPQDPDKDPPLDPVVNPTDEGDAGDPVEPIEIPETDDFFLAAAERMKKSGFIPEDFVLEEGLSEDEADERIYSAYVESIRPQAHQELLAEFQQEAARNGYDKNTLAYAHMLRNGISDEDIRGIQNYDNLAEFPLEDASKEDKMDYIRKMYVDRGWKRKEIERTLATAEVDDEIDGLSQETKDYFTERKKLTLREKQEQAEANRQQHERILQYNQAVISEVFNKGEIGGEKMTSEDLDIFEEAIYTRSIPVQVDGQVIQITPFDQFKNALSNDIALQLWAFKKLIFREQEIDRIKTAVQKETENNKVVKWGKRTTKVEPPKPPKTQETNYRQPVSPSKSGNTYIFENGELKEVPSI